MFRPMLATLCFGGFLLKEEIAKFKGYEKTPVK